MLTGIHDKEVHVNYDVDEAEQDAYFKPPVAGRVAEVKAGGGGVRTTTPPTFNLLPLLSGGY